MGGAAPERGWPALGGWCTLWAARPAAAASAAMRLDPNTHAYVLATAFFTSLTFAIFAMNVIAVALGWLLH
jgi:hypothetical protein